MTPRRIRSSQVSQLAHSMSQRELAIVESVARTRMMSGNQVRRLHCAEGSSGARACRRHLRRLTELQALVRLERRVGGVRAGSEGFVYSLDRLGQHIATGAGPAGGRRIRRPWTPSVSYTKHVLAVADLYVGLVEADRRGELELVEFLAEPRCWRSFSGPGGTRIILKPDAYVRTGAGKYEDFWFIEVDLGTESRAALGRKLRRYRQYWSSGREQAIIGVFPRVLLLADTERRRELLIDMAAAQPSESWRLFRVGLLADQLGKHR